MLWTADSPDAEGRVLFDPNELSEEGTTALTWLRVSDDGERVALGLSRAGSDWRTLAGPRRRDRRGAARPGRVEQVHVRGVDARWCRLLLRQIPGAAGRRRVRRPEPRHGAALPPPRNRHRRRRARLLASRTSPTGSSSRRSPTTAAPHRHRSCRERVRRAGSTSPTSPTAPKPRGVGRSSTGGCPIRAHRDRSTAPSISSRTTTHRSAASSPSTSTIQPGSREIIAEGDEALEHVRSSAVGSPRPTSTTPTAGWRCSSSTAVMSRMCGCPGIGSIVEMSGRRGDDELFLTFATFVSPPVVLAVRMADGAVREVGRPGAGLGPGRLRQRAGLRDVRRWDPCAAVPHPPPRHRPDRRRSHAPLRLRRLPHPDRPDLQAGVAGLDGTRRAARRRVAARGRGVRQGAGTTPVASRTSRTSSTTSPRASAGWRRPAGRRPERIAISGRSNGGLLVGATITQHPELFGAALAEVGVMDMLRFHRFTIGWAWTSDFGSRRRPRRSSGRCSRIRRSTTSEPGVAYPPTLVTTGDHDDRVVPATRSSSRPRSRRRRPATPRAHPDRHGRRPRHGQAGPQAHRRARRRPGVPRARPRDVSYGLISVRNRAVALDRRDRRPRAAAGPRRARSSGRKALLPDLLLDGRGDPVTDPPGPARSDPAGVGAEQSREEVAGQQRPTRATNGVGTGPRIGSSIDPVTGRTRIQTTTQAAERAIAIVASGLEEAEDGPPAARRRLERADAADRPVDRPLQPAPELARVQRRGERRPDRRAGASRIGADSASRIASTPAPGRRAHASAGGTRGSATAVSRPDAR